MNSLFMWKIVSYSPPKMGCKGGFTTHEYDWGHPQFLLDCQPQHTINQRSTERKLKMFD